MATVKNYILNVNDQKVYPKIKASQVYIPSLNMSLEEYYGNETLTFQDYIDLILPIGFIYKTTREIDLNNFNFDNQSVHWFWEQLEAGHILVGEGSYTDSNSETATFYPLGTETENALTGEWRHTLTVDEIPSHNHGLPKDGSDDGENYYDVGDSRTSAVSAFYTGGTGGSTPHNNMMPAKTVYMYRRVV